jgi:mono/diheme cytochrome c family protein
LSKSFRASLSSILYTLLLRAGAAGCGRRDADMYYQPKKQPYMAGEFFEDGLSARPLVPGTVARPREGLGGAYYYKSAEPGYVDLAPDDAGTAPGFPADFPTGGRDLQARLTRGQERFNIYCAVCHGMNGLGDGMIPQRGFTKPPSFVLIPQDAIDNPQRYDREQFLQTAPPRHFYDVISNGWGAMYSYAERVSPEDRWNIAAYVMLIQQKKPPLTTQAPSATIGPGKTRQTGD